MAGPGGMGRAGAGVVVVGIPAVLVLVQVLGQGLHVLAQSLEVLVLALEHAAVDPEQAHLGGQEQDDAALSHRGNAGTGLGWLMRGLGKG